MRTRVVVLTALVLCTAFFAQDQDAAAENPQNSGPLPVLEIADDFYVIQGEGSNVSVYVTDEGLILVDDKFDRTYDQLQAALRSFTGPAGEIRHQYTPAWGPQRRKRKYARVDRTRRS